MPSLTVDPTTADLIFLPSFMRPEFSKLMNRGGHLALKAFPVSPFYCRIGLIIEGFEMLFCSALKSVMHKTGFVEKLEALGTLGIEC